MNIFERVVSPTPKFFKSIRNIGIMLATISGALLTAPLALPSMLITVAGYMGIASVVASAVSQTAVTEEALAKNNDKSDGT
jgi:hypothetical protein